MGNYENAVFISYAWGGEREELVNQIDQALQQRGLKIIRADMDLYDRIRDKISGLASTLKDMNTLMPEMHRESDFSHLYNAIENRMKDSLAATTNETAESNANPKPSGNTTASNGSTTLGNIHVGGNLSGNIVIGNNNSINDKK